MTKFTPGPWSVEGRGPNMRVIFAGDPSLGERLSPCFLADGDQEANSCLIAAAPDFYEAAVAQNAAEDAHANCPECEGEGVPELCAKCFPLFDDARLMRWAALAKARGEVT